MQLASQPLIHSSTMISAIDNMIHNNFLPHAFNSMQLDEDDNTYLHHIVKFDFPKSELLILNLLRRHTIIDHTNRFGQTVFHLAAAYSRPSILKILLNEPADFFDEDNFDLQDNLGNTVVHYSSATNLPLIVSSGFFDINTKNKAGHCPLLDAIYKGDVYKVAKLLELGANPNSFDYDGNNPLHYAIIMIPTRYSIINILIENGGFNINTKNNYGKTPLDLAIEAHEFNVVYKIWSTWLFTPDDLIKHIERLPEGEMKEYLNTLLESRRSYMERFT